MAWTSGDGGGGQHRFRPVVRGRAGSPLVDDNILRAWTGRILWVSRLSPDRFTWTWCAEPVGSPRRRPGRATTPPARRAGAGRRRQNLAASEDGHDALTRLDLGDPRLLDGGEGRLRLLQPIAEHDVRREHALLVLDVVSRALVGLGKIIERIVAASSAVCASARWVPPGAPGYLAARSQGRAPPADPAVSGLIGGGVAELCRAESRPPLSMVSRSLSNVLA